MIIYIVFGAMEAAVASFSPRGKGPLFLADNPSARTSPPTDAGPSSGICGNATTGLPTANPLKRCAAPCNPGDECDKGSGSIGLAGEYIPAFTLAGLAGIGGKA